LRQFGGEVVSGKGVTRFSRAKHGKKNAGHGKGIRAGGMGRKVADQPKPGIGVKKKPHKKKRSEGRARIKTFDFLLAPFSGLVMSNTKRPFKERGNDGLFHGDKEQMHRTT